MNELEAVGRLLNTLSEPFARLLDSWNTSGLNPDMLQPIKQHVLTLATTNRLAFFTHAYLSDIDRPLWTNQRGTSLVREHGHPIAAQSIAVSGFQGKLLYRPLDEVFEQYAIHGSKVREIFSGTAEPVRRFSDLTQSTDPALRDAIERSLYAIRLHDSLEELSKKLAQSAKDQFGQDWKLRFVQGLQNFQTTFEQNILEQVKEAEFHTGQKWPRSCDTLEDILVRDVRALTPFHISMPIDVPGAHSYPFQIDRISSFRLGEPTDYLVSLDAAIVKLAGDRPHNGATMHPDMLWFQKYYCLPSLVTAFSILERSPEQQSEYFATLRKQRLEHLAIAKDSGMNEVSSDKRVVEFFKMGYTINSANTNILEPSLWPLVYDKYKENFDAEQAVRASSRLLSRSLWVASNSLTSLAYRNALITFLYENEGKMNVDEFRELDQWAHEHILSLLPESPFADVRGTRGPAIYDGAWRVLAAAENKEEWVMNPLEYMKQMKLGKRPHREWLPTRGWRKDTYHHIAYSLVLSALGKRWAAEFDDMEHAYDEGKSVRSINRSIMSRQEVIRTELSKGQGE